VFAFAMLAVEVLTGRVPFGNVGNIPVVIQIVGGKRPAKPQTAEQLGLTAEMWEFVEKCWTGNPNERSTIDEVVRTCRLGRVCQRVCCAPFWAAHKPTYHA